MPLRSRFFFRGESILGDPGAVSGGGKKSKRARKKSGEEKVKRPFRLFPAPTNCPWVSEDGEKAAVQGDIYVKHILTGHFNHFV